MCGTTLNSFYQSIYYVVVVSYCTYVVVLKPLHNKTGKLLLISINPMCCSASKLLNSLRDLQLTIIHRYTNTREYHIRKKWIAPLNPPASLSPGFLRSALPPFLSLLSVADNYDGIGCLII